MQSKRCLYCDKLFFKTVTTSQIVWDTKRRFCSSRCRAKGLPGNRKGKIYPHLWKEKPKYGQLHKQVYLKYGKPKKCSKCGSTKNVHWANKSNKYKNNNDFIALCASCHKKYDNKVNNNVVWNKGLKGEEYKKHYPNGIKGLSKGNIPWNKSNTYLICPICKKKFYTNPSAVKAGRKFCSKECYWKSPNVRMRWKNLVYNKIK